MPIPAAFRAAALRHFNSDLGDANSFLTKVVGLPGREINEAASDEVLREKLNELESIPGAVVV